MFPNVLDRKVMVVGVNKYKWNKRKHTQNDEYGHDIHSKFFVKSMHFRYRYLMQRKAALVRYPNTGGDSGLKYQVIYRRQ